MPTPVQQSSRLPFFFDSGFSWKALEGFFCDFCNALPRIWTNKYPERVRIIAAELVGQPGGSQEGVDLKLRTDSDETWFIECKHRKTWTTTQSDKVVAKAASRSADRFILALTCGTSEDTKGALRSKVGWDLWDPVTIDLLFSQLCDDNPIAASRLIHRWFGPAWLSAFDLQPSVALICSDAFYAPFDQDIFHHRLPLIGRDQKLDQIREFLADPTQRALIVSARGGLGKSRLLKEIAPMEKGDRSIWFAESGTREQFQTELTQIGGSPVVILDDAHRREGFLDDLLSAVARFPDAKVILGTRPQGDTVARAALRSSGFNSNQFSGIPLKSLSYDDAALLSEAALGEAHKRFASKLTKLSHDCPLVAVVGAHLIRTNSDLAPSLLRNEENFREDVFDKLLEVLPRKDRYRLKSLCQWIVALAPVQNDPPFRQRAAEFLDWTPTDVAGGIEELEGAGLLVPLRDGMRVIPDLLSDHLLFEACQDPSTEFVERVLATLGEDAPRLTMIRNLAEVEWRARYQGSSARTVIASLWEKYLTEFRAATFAERRKQLLKWETFSTFLPSEAIELADVTIESTEEPVGEEASPKQSYDWASTLKALPSILEPIAMHSRAFRGQALDMLWRLHHLSEIPSINANAPLKTIGRVASYGGERATYLEWLENTLMSETSEELLTRPGEEIAGLLSPLFYYEIASAGASGSGWQLSQPLRQQVTALVRKLIDRGNAITLLNLIPVLERGIRRPYPPKDSSYAAQDLVDAALEDRRATLEELLRLADKVRHPVISFVIRRALRKLLTEHPMHRESGIFIEECAQAVGEIEERGGFDLQLTISTFSHAFQECRPSGNENWRDESETRWSELNRKVCAHLLEREPNTQALGTALETFSERCAKLGFNPRYWSLFREILAADPGVAEQLASDILAEDESRLAEGIGALLCPGNRKALLLEASTSPNVTAVREFLGSVISSRLEHPFDPSEEDLIYGLIDREDDGIVNSVISSLAAGRPKPPYTFELEVLQRSAEVGIDSGAADGFLLALAVFTAGEPDRFSEPIVTELLQALVPIEALGGDLSTYELQELSKLRPNAVFEFLFSRAEEAARRKSMSYYSASDSLVQNGIEDVDEKANRLLSFLRRDKNWGSGHAELLGSLLRKAANGANIVLSWVDEAAAHSPPRLVELMKILWLAEFPFWMKPELVERISKLAKEHGTCAFDETRRRLKSSGIVDTPRGGNGGQIDVRWSAVIQRLEKLEQRFKQHPLLGPFYAALLEEERDRVSKTGDYRPAERAY